MDRSGIADAAARVLDAVGADLAAEPDGWTPSVQGAVGHVLGLRGGDGARQVLKIYAPDAARAAATEVDALGRFAAVADVATPVVIASDVLGQRHGVPYVVLSRLPGVRWADRRGELTPSQTRAVTEEVGRVLRRLHVVRGVRFGSLSPTGRAWADAWERLDARCDQLLHDHLRIGGSWAMARRTRTLVDGHRDAFRDVSASALCHNDLVDANVLVAARGEPTVVGVVDLERASWDDRMADLARTRSHVRGHDEEGVAQLATAYGVNDDERARLRVHEVLHAVEERSWMSVDRPAGWTDAVATLDAFLARRTCFL
ncbi:phosphotransferase family protein [Egicoccus sp. AB-alg6-2]|uniref:phosphotransferase family protein n=1 Tax=Egicoccus sp. AB-alg6-2 TaxID=3242692 RepID=UPI00359E35C1